MSAGIDILCCCDSEERVKAMTEIISKKTVTDEIDKALKEIVEKSYRKEQAINLLLDMRKKVTDYIPEVMKEKKELEKVGK